MALNFVAHRSYIVWAASNVVVMAVFLGFMASGWPGSPDPCIHYETTGNNTIVQVKPDECYCEAFDFAEVLDNVGGVRQPVNTWSNMYSVVTSFIIAMVVSHDRQRGGDFNIISSHNPIADLYVFVSLFLGLGSMFFHASLKTGLAWVDGCSMFFFVCFLDCYTLRRIWKSDLGFWCSYIISVVTCTLLASLVRWPPILMLLIILSVVVYIVLEIIIWRRTRCLLIGTLRSRLLWGCSVACIALGEVFWGLSQTGALLCRPTSWFQPHGLLWHTLAGATAILLFFYWREENRHKYR
eukprot:TRINITY_DN7069_c0_g1_i5.p1 TRINITY_DN7069_c0_g1~~TRINITY_DN7069_c0_g1_i5.p1  ORF type:complete len:296 (-),score=47.57 TRINITY_DN7069_c0_g1_i5:91-978(-)